MSRGARRRQAARSGRPEGRAMKFLHTADWQIGMKAAHVGAAGETIRRARLEAAKRVVDTARDQGAEFLLVAGDTFEDNGVDRVLVQKVADLLGASPVPVFVIPGNHDPWVPGSVWEHPAWAGHRTIRILGKAEPVELPGGTLYPCPVLDKLARGDPTAWIPPRRQGPEGIRIGLAHGSVEGLPQAGGDHPVPRDASQRAGLDYLALGHWHSTGLFGSPEGAAGTVRTAYSGTHETTRFGERDSGNVLLVEIHGPGEVPEITPVRSGGLRWATIDQEVGSEGDLARIQAALEAVEAPERTLVEIRLSGVLPGTDRGALDRLGELLESRFLYHRIDTRALVPAPEDEGWMERIPEGVLREAARRLREMARPGGPPGEEGAAQAAAARALQDLYAMVQGTDR